MYAGKLSIAAAKVTYSDTGLVRIENRRTALDALQSKSKYLYIIFTKCLDLWVINELSSSINMSSLSYFLIKYPYLVCGAYGVTLLSNF